MIERRLVAKEKRFTRRHRFDHRGHKRGVAGGFERQNQLAHAAVAPLPGERQQTAFDEIVLFRTQREAGLLLQSLPEKIIVKRGHDPSLESGRHRSRPGLRTI